MAKLLHTRVKVPFANPYVVRVQYESDVTEEAAHAMFRKTMRTAYRLIEGSWGYSSLEYEEVKVKDEFNHPAPPGPGHFAGMHQQVQIASLFNPDYQRRLRAYIVFTDELDALQFRLSIDTNSVQVKMWPQRWFTIHEVVETDES